LNKSKEMLSMIDYNQLIGDTEEWKLLKLKN
jgi:hypothetical protein